MSHGIDESTGKPAMAYVGERPWHGLGEKLEKGQPLEVWMGAARLNWEIERKPVQYLVEGKLRTMDDRFVLSRSDSGAALSIVSGSYCIVQPREVIEFYRDLVSQYGYTLETAGALDGGRKIWALAKTGKTSEIGRGAGDTLEAYVLLATSCDKTLATTAAFTSVRVVCQNTLFFAIDDVRRAKRPEIKVAHDSRFNALRVKVDWGLIDSAWSDFLSKSGQMALRQMKKADLESFFDGLLGKTKDKSLSARAQKERETLLSLMGSAPGQDLATAKDTLWGAVNAVSYFVDHVRAAGQGPRLDSSWFGSGCNLKNAAWTKACSMMQ